MPKKTAKRSMRAAEQNDIPVLHEVPQEYKELPAPAMPKLLKATLFLLGFGLIVASLGSSLFFFNQYQNTQKLIKEPSTEDKKRENEKVIAKISKIVEMPKEAPQVATVVDLNKLKDQPFFVNAKNGDTVLIFTKAKKAILYRESTNKIIEMAPLIQNNQDAKQEGNVAGTTTVAQAPIPISIYNGTNIVGLAGTIEKQLTEKVKEITVVSKQNAVKRDYVKTIVIDLKGDKKEMALKLAGLVNGEVSALPEGEARPAADFLIILGEN